MQIKQKAKPKLKKTKEKMKQMK
jgi:hypothetical protein